MIFGEISHVLYSSWTETLHTFWGVVKSRGKCFSIGSVRDALSVWGRASGVVLNDCHGLPSGVSHNHVSSIMSFIVILSFTTTLPVLLRWHSPPPYI